MKMHFGSKYRHLACSAGRNCVELPALSRRALLTAAVLFIAAFAAFGIVPSAAQDAEDGAGRVPAALASKADA